MSLAFCPSRAVFDLETTTITQSPYDAPVSIIQIITTAPYKKYVFDVDNIREAVDLLLASPGYVTFNGIKFDMRVLLKYMNRGEGRLFRDKPHFDIFHEFQQQHPGQLISLDNFARTTLGETKIADENGPLILYKTNPKLLEKYGVQDALLTYKLYIYYCSFGKLYYTLPQRSEFIPDTISRTSR